MKHYPIHKSACPRWMRICVLAHSALLLLAATSATAILSNTAHASGIGAPLIGTAWSGAATPDAAATYWNPALLAEIEQIELQGSLAALVAYVGYERDRRAQYQQRDGFRFRLPIDESDIDVGKAGTAPKVSDFTVAPLGTFFAAIPVHEDWTLGAGVYGVQAALLDMPDDGAQRWAVQDATIAALQATAAVAWQPLDWLDVGVGFSGVMGFLELRQLFDLATTDLLGGALAGDPINQPNDFGANAPPGVRELDVLSRGATVRRAIAWGWNFNAGLGFRPHPSTLISVAYQHQTKLRYKGEFYLDMNHPFFTTDLAAKGLKYPALVEGTAYVDLPIPASVRLGLGWQINERWQVQLHTNWVWWSQVKSLKVTAQSDDLVQSELGLGDVTTIVLPRNFNDTIEVEAAVGWKAMKHWRFGLRVGYHSPSSPDSTVDLTAIDGHRIITHLMADVELSRAFTLTTQLGVQALIPRTVTASNHDRGNGTYELIMSYAGAALTWRL